MIGQYVAIKDNIGLCTYCRGQDHRYAACPQRKVDQEAAMREKKKNKKNDKKKGKVRIIASVMMREQDSDSSVLPGGGDKRQECPPSTTQQVGDSRDHSRGEYFPKTTMSPRKEFVPSVGLLRIVIETAQ